MHHDTQISFAATSNGVTFESIHISSGLSQLNAKGTVRGYSNPIVEAEYQALVSTADLRQQLQTLPLSGEIELAGSLSYGAAGGPPLDAIKLSGHASSERLAGSLSRSEGNFRSLPGNYALRDGTLRVTRLQA